MTSWGEALRDTTAALREAGIASARLDARLLLAEALGVSSTALFSEPSRTMSGDDGAHLARLLARRLERRPMSHILGRREFWSLDFKVTADVLDPRPDTETVVEAVLESLPGRDVALSLLDLGTGSGCILLALLAELPNARGTGVDSSEAALDVARFNAQTLHLDRRTRFVLGDWGKTLDGPYDVIVSNPPYIPDGEINALEPEVALFEPRAALAGGADGLACYRALAPDIARLLAPDGLAVLETGLGQCQQVGAILEDNGLVPSGTRRDLAGVERCVMVRCSAHKDDL